MRRNLRQAVGLPEALAQVYAYRRTYPRAYEKWTEEEDATLSQLLRAGHREDEMARQLQRQPGAIRSRVQKLDALGFRTQQASGLQDTDVELEKQFHDAMLEIYRVAAAHGCHATRFKQLVHNRGGVGAARWLLAKKDAQGGLTKLWELGLLEHSTEALVFQERFHPLFTEAEVHEARQRLEALGYPTKP